MTQYVWKPFEVLQQPEGKNIAVIKLNSQFSCDSDLKLFIKLWKHAKIRSGADGGGNVLYDSIPATHQPPYLPHYISGDFDSLRKEVKKFYEDKGVQLLHTPDQNETDFTKCLRILKNKSADFKLDAIVTHVGACLRRLDHTLSNINTLLYHSPPSQQPTSPTPPTHHPTSPAPPTHHPISPAPSTHHPSFELTHTTNSLSFLFIIMGDNITFILPPGTHTIFTSSPLRGKWCSLVPIVGPTRTTTTGLVYNMTDELMSFGGLISTSNACHPSADHVFVENDQSLLFSIGIKF